MPAVSLGSEQSASTDPDGLPPGLGLKRDRAEHEPFHDREWASFRNRHRDDVCFRAFDELRSVIHGRERRDRGVVSRVSRPVGTRTRASATRSTTARISTSHLPRVFWSGGEARLPNLGSPAFVGQGCRGAGTPLAVSVHRAAIPHVTTSTSSGRRGVIWWIAAEVLGRLRSSPQGNACATRSGSVGKSG
jgi:hypothetical protein